MAWGTDSTERGRTMWERVKGKTENDLPRLPFRAAYMMRPGLIIPENGIRSKTKSYRVLYAVTRPILPLLGAVFPKYVTTTTHVGRAIAKVAKFGAPESILENPDINRM
jgi:hypothetical protein